jgi:hypothetical protein
MKQWFLFLLLGSLSAHARENSSGPPVTDREQVLRIVQGFFDALAKHDGEALRPLCAPGSQVTAGPRPGTTPPALRQRTVEADIEWLNTNQDQLLERMWNPTVLIEGRIAVVWAPYDFHRNAKFSHNGIDVFTLMKLDGVWKIVSTAYSIEPEGPSRNPAGSP